MGTTPKPVDQRQLLAVIEETRIRDGSARAVLMVRKHGIARSIVLTKIYRTLDVTYVQTQLDEPLHRELCREMSTNCKVLLRFQRPDGVPVMRCRVMGRTEGRWTGTGTDHATGRRLYLVDTRMSLCDPETYDSSREVLREAGLIEEMTGQDPGEGS